MIHFFFVVVRLRFSNFHNIIILRLDKFTNTNFLPGNTDYDRALLIQPDVMRSPVVWLCSEGANTFNGQRVIATAWDDSMPIDQCLAQASSPAAWPPWPRHPWARVA